jgi:hypothetical protein
MSHITPHELFPARIASRISVEDCWLWEGATTNGYASMWLDGLRVYGHRKAYELAKGPIAANRQIDHLCRRRNCVNPDHLEAVTQRTNILRGQSPSARQARQTLCKRGHPLSGDNLERFRDGKRRCKQCRHDYVEGAPV